MLTHHAWLGSDRQKTADPKTHCPCGDGKKAPPGGRGRGKWCGGCLELRMGENLDEALANPAWRCPVCRDVCNCSGANCQRHSRDLAPTAQLHAEAMAYGWDSVAHYLILTELREGKALAMEEVERELHARCVRVHAVPLMLPVHAAKAGTGRGVR